MPVRELAGKFGNSDEDSEKHFNIFWYGVIVTILIPKAIFVSGLNIDFFMSHSFPTDTGEAQ
jgi:hypothetical protein